MMLHFEEIQTPTGRIIDVFEELEMQTIWYHPQKDMYIIFHQEIKPGRQYGYWYNGEVATIILQNKLFIKLNALRSSFSNKISNVNNENADHATGIWQIDIYNMKECTDLDDKIKRQIFNVNCYKDKLRGSFELVSHDFKQAILEINDNKDILLEINN